METEIYANLAGQWTKLLASDKIQGTLAYNWLEHNDIHDLEEFVGIKHDGIEHIVHRSCMQLTFVKGY